MLFFFIQRANHPYSSFDQIIVIEVLLPRSSP